MERYGTYQIMIPLKDKRENSRREVPNVYRNM